MIKSRFTLKQLEAFVQVVDTGSFRKAAAVLGTTQPNVSARIAALEASLGVVLMHRDAGSVRLTAVGTTLLSAARDVLRSGEAFLEAADRRDLLQERLRLGVTELIACTWLHAFLRRLKTNYPSLKVELQVDLSREIDRALQSGDIDLALQTTPFTASVDASLPLGAYDYVWVAAPGIAVSLGVRPTPEKLFRHTVLTHARHTQAARDLSEFAVAHGLEENQIVHSSSLASCVPMVIDGMGVAVLPERIVRADIADGRLQRINVDWTPRQLESAARYDLKRTPRFVQHAATLAQAIAKSYNEK